MPEPAGRSTAAAAAEQVRAIVEAAEQAAERIRAEAERESAAAAESVERIARRAEELERRLEALAEGVRTAIAGLREELDALQRAGAGPPDGEPAVAAGESPVEVELDEEVIAAAEEAAAPEPDARAPEAAAPDVAEPELPEAEPSAIPEGARVLALKMALDGTPREDTARYLRENFELADADALLDEVYAKAGR